jgi:hypothetical protein
MKFIDTSIKFKLFFLFVSLAALVGGCGIKTNDTTPRLLKTESSTSQDLKAEVNRFASVTSMRAKMYLKFEDNSFAEFGNKEVYRQADGEVVVQRPAKILLKVQVPIIKSDVAQMTSDGETFRVAILQDGGSGRYRKFLKGTNSADYSRLQKSFNVAEPSNSKAAKENVNAFANLRPQHFTDAMLVRPINDADVYTQSTIFQIEEDTTLDKKSPLRKVMRGYYLLDEFEKQDAGDLKISRRFWFDRVGGIRLARQQIFDAKGEIESDIVYGKEGSLGNGQYSNLPLEVTVTRPHEKYSMKLTYRSPEEVMIGNTFPDAAFVLQNSWKLEEIDLDKKLREAIAAQTPTGDMTSPLPLQ